MADESEETTVSIEDVVKSINEEQAIVMGGIDDRACCSFTKVSLLSTPHDFFLIKGYMKRQAIYTCRTCLDTSNVHAGFCYPCLLSCHDGHDTLELYTKRNFRCDCGNQNFAPFQCKLWEEKDDENVDNQYNHNFSNSYCICQRPYPDEEYEGNEEMIQCGLCEDWFHVEHLNLPDDVAAPDEYEEMTCSQCLRRCAFLCLYALSRKEQPWCMAFSTLLSSAQVVNGHVNIEPETKRLKLDGESNGPISPSLVNDCELLRIASDLEIQGFDFKKLRVKDLGLSDDSKVPSVFWSSGWRERLCRCPSCVTLYKYLNVSYLLDPEDTMEYYLALGEKKAIEIEKEENEALSEALSELPHSVASHIAAGVNYMKETLEEFLKKKHESGCLSVHTLMVSSRSTRKYCKASRRDNIVFNNAATNNPERSNEKIASKPL
ncbi:hypothetical protein T265_09729 [Opisthorchis viverrini]|uniref:UBR-type domain-containing protein n=1 Tax=Opisthorchis viverrini TaxID=6198 RepID=A0A074Z4R7_OPIVI|nr:hypothetical protein T265_09729 [Opisthorchis viverrini]KER22076.1 hypothetical protein T265_09729 [Opisthorchis viverrini]